MAVARVAASGRILARRVERVDRSSARAPVEQICRMVEALRGQDPRERAAGVAVPGLVRARGTVWAPNLPGWERVPLARLLRRRLGVPVVVESDRNAAVVGEAWRGAGRGASDVVVLIVGTGIGAGILSGGRLVRGAHGLSGCAGWMVVTPEERARFRRVGCLEALAAGPAVARAGGRQTAEEVAGAARRGDARAVKALRRAGRFLGAGVANLISLFDPEVVVLGGGLAAAADLYLPTLERVARAASQPLAARQVRIRVSRLGGDANLLGVARLAWEALRARPRTTEGP